MNEVWKPIEGYEELYEVSNLGRVRSLDRYILQTNRWGGVTSCYKKGVVLKPKLEREGRYLTVSLWRNGKHCLRYIHRLVAIAFINNPKNYSEVNHKDENKCNNCVSNLEWCDRAYNSTYGKLKNHFKGSKNPSVKLSESDVRKIRTMINEGLSDLEISQLFNVTTSNIYYIRIGKSWGWLT